MPALTHRLRELRAVALMLLFSWPLLVACGSGDDDGRRLGDILVGTWQRGWDEGDVVIEGMTDLAPENIAYDRFVFRGDGSYNGMVRQGSFTATDREGVPLLEGTYRCDNRNLRLEFTDGGGHRQAILAQVLSYTGDTVMLSYQHGDGSVTVRLVLRKRAADGYSSSVTSRSWYTQS